MPETLIKPLIFSRETRKFPVRLSTEAKRFRQSLVKEYQITDAAGLMLLRRACEAIDRLRRAQKLIKQDGEVISDKKGSVKAHPAIKIEETAHKQFVEALKMLNLDLEPLRDRTGRPGGK